MDPTPAEGPRVVVGVDDSQAARWALAWAIGEARLRGMPLLVVHTARLPNHVAAPGLINSEVIKTLRAMGAHLITGMLDEVAGGAPPDVRVSALSLVGDPGDTLVKLARDTDILVIGRGARSILSRLLRPSVQRHCARRARSAFMCVGPPAPRRPRGRARLNDAPPTAAPEAATAGESADDASDPGDDTDPGDEREPSLFRRLWPQRRRPRRAHPPGTPREAPG